MKRLFIIAVVILVVVAPIFGGCAPATTTTPPTTAPLVTTPTPTYTLSASVSPSGAGSVSPPGGKYESGLQVTLTATPASGYAFDYWDGAASGSSPTVTITMNSDKSTTAHFKAVETPTPKPTQTPTPTPTQTLGYSRSNPVGVNIPLTITVSSVGSAATKYGPEYNVRVTLLEFVRGDEAWQRIKAAQGVFADIYQPKAGFEYIAVRVRFDYLSGPTPDAALDVSTVWFKVISGEGKEYEFSFYAGNLDPSITTSLYPSASHEGWVAFFVAQDDTRPLLTFGRAYDGTGGIWFKLY